MLNCQETLFRWIIAQPGLTGLVMFAAGSLCAFQGFRFFRFLLTVSCAVLGGLIGAGVAPMFHWPYGPPALACAAVGALAAFVRPRSAVTVTCAVTWAGLGCYLLDQFGARMPVVGVAALAAGGLGMLFAWLNFRAMTVVLTVMQGAILMVLGFVGLTHDFFPSLGTTFRDWAGDQAWIVPLLLTMVIVTAYSVQAAQRQGDIVTGA